LPQQAGIGPRRRNMGMTKEVRMSPVVPVGLGAIDAALIAQTIYAVRDLNKKKPDQHDRK
jgi:hypothetical protein